MCNFTLTRDVNKTSFETETTTLETEIIINWSGDVSRRRLFSRHELWLVSVEQFCSAVLQNTSASRTPVQIQDTSEFFDVYVMRLISRTSSESVNIYEISVYILC